MLKSLRFGSENEQQVALQLQRGQACARCGTVGDNCSTINSWGQLFYNDEDSVVLAVFGVYRLDVGQVAVV